jgi:hypothetical protein
VLLRDRINVCLSMHSTRWASGGGVEGARRVPCLETSCDDGVRFRVYRLGFGLETSCDDGAEFRVWDLGFGLETSCDDGAEFRV